MKLLKFGLSLIVIVFLSFTAISCSEKKSEKVSKETEVKNNEEHGHESGDESSAENHDMTDMQMDHSAMDMGDAKKSNAIVASYLQLKNALVGDNSKKAGVAAGTMLKAFKEFDASGFSADEQKEIDEILEDAIEMAEHIEKSADDMEHQREHLVTLSVDLVDFIAIVGSDTKLYQDHCPMANDKKGAIWLSASKEIQNPYLGTKMPTCGSVQKEI